MRKLTLILVMLVALSAPAFSQMTDQQFGEMMKKYLASDAGQESLATSLQTFARRQQEKQMEQQLDEQFKSPVKIEIGTSPVKGPADAPITVVEFSDFECPFCKRGAATVDELMKAYPGKVKLVYKNRPLNFHKQARPAAKAALAAHAQGKFFEYYHELFTNQQRLSEPTFYEETAKKLGLDVAKWKTAMESAAVEEQIKADEKIADSLGVNGTPSFFINGVNLQGAQPLPEFKRVVDRWLTKK